MRILFSLKNLILQVLLISCCICNASEVNEEINMASNCTIFGESVKVFKAIIDDMESSYEHLGGPMTSIQIVETNVFKVTVLQEERADSITYSFDVDDECNLTIKNKEYSVWTPDSE